MKAFQKLILLLLLIASIACSSSTTLPEFEYNGKTRNRWITNRIPDYGITGRDGCIIMGEMKVSLTRTEPAYYSGLISDADQSDSLMFATLIINPGSYKQRKIETDHLGRFSFIYSDRISQISIEGLHTRKLLVNLR